MNGLLPWQQKHQLIDTFLSIVNTDAILQLRGTLLGLEYQQDNLRGVEARQKLKIWTRMLRLASNERSVGLIYNSMSTRTRLLIQAIQDLSTRTAAVSSIQGFQSALRQHDSRPLIYAELLDVYCCIYDTLTDDDEEIRQQGASIVSWVLSEPTSNARPEDVGSLSLSPLAANTRLLDFIVSSYGDSTALCVEALRRLIDRKCLETLAPQGHSDLGSPNGSVSLQFTPLKELLRIARQEDTALFVEEKQNLFIDEVQEAERWAGALQRLSSAAIPVRVVSDIETWVLDGLAVHIDIANHEFDGPLGWTSKPSVFTLGMQVILAAEVFLCWARKGYYEVNNEKMWNALCTLRHVGNQSSLHIIWLQRLQQLIGEYQ